MADERIKDIATEAPSPAADDFIESDGATKGTRKIAVRTLDNTGRAQRPGMITAGTSVVGTTQDAAVIQPGTTSFAIGGYARRSAFNVLRYYVTKFAGNNGFKVEHTTGDLLQLRIGNGTNFTTFAYPSTVATGLSAGAWYRWDAIVNRTAQTLTWLINGAQLGAPIDISGSSAQTLNSTGPLLWGSDGTTHFLGMYGSHYWLNGLLTATDIANAAGMGGMEPFCVWTLNTTTGQSVPTLNGLPFYAWPNFGVGYGAIAPDRGGNNQHALLGATGLTHFVPRNPPGVPQRAPKTALVGDGSNGSFVRALPGVQNPNTGAFGLYIDGIWGPPVDGSVRVLAVLTASDTSWVQPRSLTVAFNNGNSVIIRLYGATSADYRQFAITGTLYSMLVAAAGRRVVIIITRGKCYIGVDGELFNVGSLIVESTDGGGSSPAWTDQIDGTYFKAFYGTTTTSGVGSIFALRTYNVEMTEAQWRGEYLNGEPQTMWVKGSRANILSGNNSTFDSGLGTWSNGAGGLNLVASVDATTVAGKMYVVLAAAGGCYVRLASVISSAVGSRYRITLNARLASGTAMSLSAGDRDGTVALGGRGAFLPTGVEQTFSMEFVTVGSGDIAIGATTGSNGSAYEFDDVQVERLGVTTRLRTDGAAGFVAPNDCYDNGSSDFAYSTTGVSVSPEPLIGRRATIRNNFAHSSISTLPGTTILGTLPFNWSFVEEHANVTNALDAGITISTGTSGTPGRFTNALPVSTTGPKAQATQQLQPQSTTANTTLYISKSGSSTVGDLLPVNAVIERKY